MSEPLDLAELALAQVPGGDGALASTTRERSLFLRYAGSRPTQATAVDDLTVEVAVVRDGHVGRATTNGTDVDALARCASRAASAAAEAAVSGPGAFPGFARPGGAPVERSAAEAASLDPAVGSGALEAAFRAAAAAGVEAHGTWTAGEVETAVASSDGGHACERATDAFMKVVCIAPSGRSGYAAASARSADALAPGALAERAATKATLAGEPAQLEDGEHTVVMEPAAVGILLQELAACAFNGLAHHEGRGALSGRLGRQVAAPLVNIADAPHYRSGLRRAYDAEGLPKRPLPLIQDGVAHRVVHDTSSGALAGVPSTAHALEPGGSSGGPEPVNLVMAGGGGTDETELCAPVDRGVYVTRLWYQNVVRPSESLVTAVTRDGTFLIEDGRVTRPLEDVRLTDSVLGILARTQALSRSPSLTSEGEFYGRRFAVATVCPAIRASRVRLSRSSAAR